MNLTDEYNQYIMWTSVAEIKVTKRYGNYNMRGKRSDIIFPGIQEYLGIPELLSNDKKHSIVITFKDNIKEAHAKMLNLEYDEVNIRVECYGGQSLFNIKEAAVTWIHKNHGQISLEMIAADIHKVSEVINK